MRTRFLSALMALALSSALSLSLSLGLPAAAAAATGIDLHAYWDSRCAGCHGESGAFSRRMLEVADGRLRGRHHRDDLERFLGQHHAAAELVGPLVAMLQAQRQSPPLFADRCARCHGRASDFVRGELAWQADGLVSRANGRPVAPLLQRHGRLSADERTTLMRSLERVAAEVGLR